MIIYFSSSDTVEKKFEELLSSIGSVDFMGKVGLFLGTEFTWIEHNGGHVSVSLTQQSFTETLLDSLQIARPTQSSFLSPYRSIVVLILFHMSPCQLQNVMIFDYGSLTFTSTRSGFNVNGAWSEKWLLVR